MQPVNLFDLASHQARWLSVRQSVVAGNIANINTPGYRAAEVEPFEQVLDDTRVALKTTNPLHLVSGATSDSYAVNPVETDAPLLPSDNSVVLEDELVKQGEVKRAYEMNTEIVKAFHRMLMMTARS